MKLEKNSFTDVDLFFFRFFLCFFFLVFFFFRMTENIISHVAIASLSVCADPGSEPECGKAERLNEHQYKLYKSCKMQKRGYALFCSLLSLTSFEVNETAQNRIFFFRYV